MSLYGQQHFFVEEEGTPTTKVFLRIVKVVLTGQLYHSPSETFWILALFNSSFEVVEKLGIDPNEQVNALPQNPKKDLDVRPQSTVPH